MSVNIHYKNINFTNFNGSETENCFVLLKAIYLARGHLVDKHSSP
jgi:hypothetical protein